MLLSRIYKTKAANKAESARSRVYWMVSAEDSAAFSKISPQQPSNTPSKVGQQRPARFAAAHFR